MSPIASLHSDDSDLSIDLPVSDLVTLLLIFSHAWKADDLWEPNRQPLPMPRSTVSRRMDILGFTEQQLVEDYQTHGRIWLSDLDRSHGPEWDESDEEALDREAVEYLRTLLVRGSEAISDSTWSPKTARLAGILCTYWIDEAEAYPTETTVIRTALRVFRPSERLYVSISQQALFDLIPNEVTWEEDQFPEIASLGSYRTRLAWRNTKPIVLVEGSFDSKVLNATFELRFPDFADCLSIADFTQGAEGGTGGLRRALRTLAQLEIPNSILGLFDNDAAGREAVGLLATDNLPMNIGFACYPDLEFARSYPTIGPTGPAKSDINGRALSIELFLGLDCLTQNDGTLMPIEWTGYNRRVRGYQGAIVDKGAVQGTFRKKVKQALKTRSFIKDEWSSLDLLGQFVIQQISDIGARRSSLRMSGSGEAG